MEKRDARTLKIAAQQELRNQVVRMRKKGMKNPEIAVLVGLSSTTISGIWSKYKKGGMKAITIQKRGRRVGEKKNLSKEQEAKLIKRLVDITPKQLKFKFVLWTREAVQQLIKHDCDIDMPISTVGKYLQRWEFTSQVPIKRLAQQASVQKIY